MTAARSLQFGKHKGYGLAMLTCLLGGLAGTFDVESGRMNGIFMQVIDVNAFTPVAEYQEAVRAFLDGIKSTPPAQGFDEVLVPGDFENRSQCSAVKRRDRDTRYNLQSTSRMRGETRHPHRPRHR